MTCEDEPENKLDMRRARSRSFMAIDQEAAMDKVVDTVPLVLRKHIEIWKFRCAPLVLDPGPLRNVR